MGGVVHADFGAVLERKRDHLNARFAHVRRTNRGLEAAPFMEFLRLCVEPAVVAATAAGQSEASIERLTIALYDIGLELVSAEFAGPGGRFPVVSRLWCELLPRVVRLLDERARDTVAALTNAVVNLTLEPGVSAQGWLDTMLDLSGELTSQDELLRLGQLVAWRVGMAHFRESVLAGQQTVGPGLVEQVLGGIDPHERWPTASGGLLRVVATVGDFRGLGGPFDTPPRVVQSGGRLFAFDNEACFSVHADRFGTVLKRFARELPSAEARPARFTHTRSKIVCDGVEACFDIPHGATSVAMGDEMALVTLGHSHRILIVAESA